MGTIELNKVYLVDRGEFKLGLVYDLFKTISWNGTLEFVVGYFLEYPSELWKIYPEELEEIR